MIAGCLEWYFETIWNVTESALVSLSISRLHVSPFHYYIGTLRKKLKDSTIPSLLQCDRISAMYRYTMNSPTQRWITPKASTSLWQVTNITLCNNKAINANFCRGCHVMTAQANPAAPSFVLTNIPALKKLWVTPMRLKCHLDFNFVLWYRTIISNFDLEITMAYEVSIFWLLAASCSEEFTGFITIIT